MYMFEGIDGQTLVVGTYPASVLVNFEKKICGRKAVGDLVPAVVTSEVFFKI